MPTRVLCAGLLAVFVPALALAGPEAPPPAYSETVGLGDGRSITFWPYTANDYSGQEYDPVNLLFPDLDPRQIRQALLGLTGPRTLPPGTPPTVPFAGCVWADAVGSEQVAWAETEGWVGGEVQLACLNPDAPPPLNALGDHLRIHLRLYRQGEVTLGAAHFEILIPVTAGHQVLSWDFARDFVVEDMKRAGLAVDFDVPVQPFDPFREIITPLYLYFLSEIGFFTPEPYAVPFLILLGLPLGPPPGAVVPIPTDQMVVVLSGELPFDPIQEKIHTEVEAPYSVTTERPFCSGGAGDYVTLSGSLTLTLDVHTNPSGKFERRHQISGTLYVTPLGSTEADPALIREDHRALLTDQIGKLREEGSQELLAEVPQSLWWRLDAGQVDRYQAMVTCE